MGKTRRTFRIDEELDAKLNELAQGLDKNLTDTFIHLLETYLGRDSNQYEFLDEACPALQHLEDGFHCCFKVPKAKPWKLGDGGQDDARKVCTSCKTLRGIKELQTTLEQGGTAHYHSCAAAGVLHPHDPDLIMCPYKNSMTYVSIKRHCQTRNQGKPCEYLQVHTVDIKGIKPRKKDGGLNRR